MASPTAPYGGSTLIAVLDLKPLHPVYIDYLCEVRARNLGLTYRNPNVTPMGEWVVGKGYYVARKEDNPKTYLWTKPPDPTDYMKAVTDPCTRIITLNRDEDFIFNGSRWLQMNKGGKTTLSAKQTNAVKKFKENNGSNVLVCGSKNYNNAEYTYRVLNSIWPAGRFGVVHTAYTYTDAYANTWGLAKTCPIHAFPLSGYAYDELAHMKEPRAAAVYGLYANMMTDPAASVGMVLMFGDTDNQYNQLISSIAYLKELPILFAGVGNDGEQP